MSSVVYAKFMMNRFLTPPILNPTTTLKEVTCTRPMREGCFNISTEIFSAEKTKKNIIHCYGHGGAGWNTLFGSVAKAINHFKRDFPVNKRIPIRIIGAGCIGLTTAIELAHQGYNIAGVTASELYDIPSWRAAGYFALVSVKTSAHEKAGLDELTVQSFQIYQQIERGEHPYIPQDAVRYMPVYCSRDTESGVEFLESQNLIPRRKDVILDFGNGVRRSHFVEYMTYFIDTIKFMKQLTSEVKKLHIPIHLQTIGSFREVEEEIIFDCSGLGARELNHDKHMIPVRGHLILLNALSGTGHMDYMIYSKVQQDDKESYIYLFPKSRAVSSDQREGIYCSGVLGATFIPDADKLAPEDLKELDRREFQKMLDRNSLFFHGKSFPR